MNYIALRTHTTVIFFIILLSFVGVIGLAENFAQLLAWISSYPISLLNVDIVTEGNRFILSRENSLDSTFINILNVHNFSLYYGLIIVQSLIISTPSEGYICRVKNLIKFTIIVIFSQMALIIGFALDTSTLGAYDEVAIYSYSAWWTMGPILIVAFWYWKFWRNFWSE